MNRAAIPVGARRPNLAVLLIVCAAMAGTMLTRPSAAIACPCAAVSHAMVWIRDHPPPRARTSMTRPSRSPIDPAFVLLLVLAPAATIAVVTMHGRGVRLDKRRGLGVR